MTFDDPSANVSRLELDGLRARMRELRRELTGLDAAELAGTATPEQLTRIAELRAAIDELRGPVQHLTELLEGPDEKVTYTAGEHTRDFLKEYGLWVAAVVAMLFAGMAGWITQWTSSPTEEEARILRDKGYARSMDALRDAASMLPGANESDPLGEGRVTRPNP